MRVYIPLPSSSHLCPGGPSSERKLLSPSAPTSSRQPIGTHSPALHAPTSSNTLVPQPPNRAPIIPISQPPTTTTILTTFHGPNVTITTLSRPTPSSIEISCVAEIGYIARVVVGQETTMAPRSQMMANGISATPVASPPAPLLNARIKVPRPLRFPLLVLINFLTSATLYTLTSDFRAGDLASVSRSVNEWWEVVGLLGCRTLELAVGWFGNYDSTDLASLTLLTHLPPLYLLTTFYSIRPTTLLFSLFIDILSTTLPFYLLRPPAAVHTASPPPHSISNRSILTDTSTKLALTALAASLYALTVYISFATFLPLHLVTHFSGLRDIGAAHGAAFPFLIWSFLPVGYAAREFLFAPSAGAKKDLADIRRSAFNPRTASLGETVRWNVWGFSKGKRVLVQRTVTLAVVGWVSAWYQVYFTVEGAEGYGAAVWAGIWAGAAVVTGVAFAWVEDVDGVQD